ncbi:1-acyl-sn-glycerol-3-phosphate acyltransferase [Lujinxingia sediminis]|uniref:1-acyl-sn-glycerol-3-phosphate acyltransferase n=2 Tax=Lujinxingia sediminis TaxID=2480984 RepID=A0ABY0CTZ3_9DELT|nr:1-acyl-sn-glycerol-3-phosphate acyltransferase [Lujinxingia sediminis]
MLAYRSYSLRQRCSPGPSRGYFCAEGCVTFSAFSPCGSTPDFPLRTVSMLTLDTLKAISLTRRPLGQVMFASGVLTPNFKNPLTRTDIHIEGMEKLPRDRPVIFAMNHTDRYNYWPFQWRLWRDEGMFTTTWVKGKYYNNPAIQTFMIKMNNLAVPSRGYLITADAVRLLGRPPAERAYRMVRKAVDGGSTDTRSLREQAAEEGVLSDVVALLDTPRDLLGLNFDPQTHNYLERIAELFKKMMDRFVELNEEAFGIGLHVLVFPEGTRSVRLQEGRTGLAQMALRMKATVVPVGCNGSDLAYPGNSPLSSGGTIVYRLGEPMTPEGDLAPFSIAEDYTPFTLEAERDHAAAFRGMTDLVMDRINDLLDERHQRLEGHEGKVKGANRFI